MFSYRAMMIQQISLPVRHIHHLCQNNRRAADIDEIYVTD